MSENRNSVVQAFDNDDPVDDSVIAVLFENIRETKRLVLEGQRLPPNTYFKDETTSKKVKKRHSRRVGDAH